MSPLEEMGRYEKADGCTVIVIRLGLGTTSEIYKAAP